ncbi:MAG: hypothetical protein J7647_14610 [Cyanobacteria bacterium SBLK]|nr:hypothetical protein [Cyanobacteria bacterium SBLK]
MFRFIPLFLIFVLGVAGVLGFGYYALIDWNALQLAYLNFDDVAQKSPDLTALFAAEARQNIHRINLFADGVWTLQSAILAAIGVHGICTLPRKTKG